MVGSASSSAVCLTDAPALFTEIERTVEPDGVELSCLDKVSFEGRLFLDQVSATQWVLTDVVLHAKVTLTGSEMALEIADDGMDAMVISFQEGSEEFDITQPLSTLMMRFL